MGSRGMPLNSCLGRVSGLTTVVHESIDTTHEKNLRWETIKSDPCTYWVEPSLQSRAERLGSTEGRSRYPGGRHELQCSICRRWRAASEFPAKDVANFWGRLPRCRECVLLRGRMWVACSKDPLLKRVAKMIVKDDRHQEAVSQYCLPPGAYAERQRRIAEHADRIERMGLAGDGRRWHDNEYGSGSSL